MQSCVPCSWIRNLATHRCIFTTTAQQCRNKVPSANRKWCHYATIDARTASGLVCACATFHHTSRTWENRMADWTAPSFSSSSSGMRLKKNVSVCASFKQNFAVQQLKNADQGCKRERLREARDWRAVQTEQNKESKLNISQCVELVLFCFLTWMYILHLYNFFSPNDVTTHQIIEYIFLFCVCVLKKFDFLPMARWWRELAKRTSCNEISNHRFKLLKTNRTPPKKGILGKTKQKNLL